jgi:hypothetical protein
MGAPKSRDLDSGQWRGFEERTSDAASLGDVKKQQQQASQYALHKSRGSLARCWDPLAFDRGWDAFARGEDFGSFANEASHGHNHLQQNNVRAEARWQYQQLNLANVSVEDESARIGSERAYGLGWDYDWECDFGVFSAAWVFQRLPFGVLGIGIGTGTENGGGQKPEDLDTKIGPVNLRLLISTNVMRSYNHKAMSIELKHLTCTGGYH